MSIFKRSLPCSPTLTEENRTKYVHLQYCLLNQNKNYNNKYINDKNLISGANVDRRNNIIVDTFLFCQLENRFRYTQCVRFMPLFMSLNSFPIPNDVILSMLTPHAR